jgi:hypothetical protein
MTVIRPFTQSRIKIEQGPGKVLVAAWSFYGKCSARHEAEILQKKSKMQAWFLLQIFMSFV